LKNSKVVLFVSP